MFGIKKKKKRVLVLWYTVDNNLGDYYIYTTVTSFLRQWGFEYVSMEVGSPYECIAQAAKRCDFVWFAGGGIIERGIPNIILNIEKYLQCSRRVKYGITGLSIGEFDYSKAADSLSSWVRNSEFFYTRDAYSANELNRISNSTKVKACVDVVFALDVESIVEKIDNSFELGINFRELPYVDLSGEFQWERWNEEISRINKTIAGIPDQHDCSDKVGYKLEKDYTPEKALNIIGQCEDVLAMRYHVLLLAARLGKIPIPIAYCPKVTRLAEQLGITGLTLGVHDYDKLAGIIRLADDNKIDYDKIIKDSVRQCECEAQTMFNNIEEYMLREIK